jgi:hypothetical protein
MSVRAAASIRTRADMVDIFALALPHALLLVALWRIAMRDDLDREDADTTANAVQQEKPDARSRIRRGVRVHD